MLAVIRNGRLIPRAAMLALIAGALIVRVLIPQGWMPAATGGGFSLTICTGMGPMRVTDSPGVAMSPRGMHHMPAGQDHGSGDHPCTYASAVMAMAEPLLPMLDLLAPMAATIPAASSTAVSLGRGLAAPPPPSTGPPSNF